VVDRTRTILDEALGDVRQVCADDEAAR